MMSSRFAVLLLLPATSYALSDSRWRGNFKPPIRKLSVIPKAKKHVVSVHSDGTTLELEKKRYESMQHVITKALIWSLFQSDYSPMYIEKDIGDPDYLPDVVSSTSSANVLFWGESGRMSVDKAIQLAKRYPDTHFVNIRWGVSLSDYTQDFEKALRTIPRNQPFQFGAIPDVWDYCNDETGEIQISMQDVDWLELT